ncbi:hypothetical protein SmJEL517_g02105 [Synchytrium microbalum]|uniref:Ras GEF n=1 Tax=Synchytrium microbalum TaxID=1806994 RepID=A0A507C7L1_9FUNG|nr:uncharacterized protein SmJEL517_g02105 [Synchytrium microbalum]TPX35592.1 hypothetical protein SmJEL517_g02105 [Synchytrium microbalum]
MPPPASRISKKRYIDIVEAIYDYESADDSCLSFKRGEILRVYAKDNSGWWDGVGNEKRGWFPSNFVTSIKDQDRRASSSNSLASVGSSFAALSMESTSIAPLPLATLDDSPPAHANDVKRELPRPVSTSTPSLATTGRETLNDTNAPGRPASEAALLQLESLERALSLILNGGGDISVLSETVAGSMPSSSNTVAKTAATVVAPDAEPKIPSPTMPLPPIANAETINVEPVEKSLSGTNSPIPAKRIIDISIEEYTVVKQVEPSKETTIDPPKNVKATESPKTNVEAKPTVDEPESSPRATESPKVKDSEPSPQTVESPNAKPAVKEASPKAEDSLAPLVIPSPAMSGSTIVKERTLSSPVKEALAMFESKALEGKKTPPPTITVPSLAPTGGIHDIKANNPLEHPISPRIPTVSPAKEPTSANVMSWDLLADNIVHALSDLNGTNTLQERGKYLGSANNVVATVRYMLECAGITSKSSHVVSLPSIKTHYKNLTPSLSRLVLTAKVASGISPPADAADKVKEAAGQLLDVIRDFVNAGKTAGVKLIPRPPPQKDVNESKEISDVEMVARLEVFKPAISGGLRELVRLAELGHNEPINPDALAECARSTVTDIGQLLSMLEDIPVVEVPDLNAALKTFRARRDFLYSLVNDLVSAVRLCADEFAPISAIADLVDISNAVQHAVLDTIISTKTLIHQKEAYEQKVLNSGEFKSLTDLLSSPSRRNADKVNWALVQNKLTLPRGGRAASTQPSTPSSIVAESTFTRSPSVPSHKPLTPSSMASSYDLPTRDTDTDSNSRPGSAFSSQNDISIMSGRHSAYDGSSDEDELFDTSSRSTSVLSKGNFKTMKLRDKKVSLSSDVSTGSSKLLAFFGADSSESVARASMEIRKKAWFLEYDSPSNDISFNMEGQVNGGTFPSLVERLTIHDVPVDPHFMSAFLMMFRSFGTPSDLVDLLIKRFFIEPPVGMVDDEVKVWKEKKQTPIRLRVYNAFKTWLETFWNESTDTPMLTRIHEFAEGPMTDHMPKIGVRLAELCRKQAEGTLKPATKKTFSAVSQDGPTPIVPRSFKRVTLHDLDHLELARQLTLMEVKMFYAIEAKELINQEWAKGKTNSCAIHITGWVAESILLDHDVKKRASTLKYFIKVGDRLMNMNNFNTLLAILSALNSSTISRLRKTWDLLSEKTRKTFELLKASTDHSKNYAVYRQHLRTCSPPCLPFLGVYLTDLTFCEDGNPNKRNDGRLINFDKYSKSARIILDVQKYQNDRYNFIEVVDLQEWLLKQLERSEKVNATDLYRVSLALEPKEETRN